MLQKQTNRYSDTCNKLRACIEDHNYKIKVTVVNEQNKQQYQEKIEECHQQIEGLDVLKNYISPIIKDIVAYLGARKKQSMQTINGAIRMASEIIPSAMPNIHLEIKGDEAWVQTSDGMLVRSTEGTGYKSVLSAFLRTLTVNSNPLNLQTIIFDEIFAKLSVENSAKLSLFLPLMVKDMQIISIEQKPEVYANVDYLNYEFTLQNGITYVKKEMVNNGSIQANEVTGD